MLLINQGLLQLGALGADGQVQGTGFSANRHGGVQIDIGGVALNAFDRLNLTGAATLSGALDLALIGGFVPALGQTFNILTATGGVSGAFTAETQPVGMPAGLFFGVAYQTTLAQLVVIDHLPGDYNKNGVVDTADYVVWRSTLGQAVAFLSGADGNGNGAVDNGDYSFWRARFGQLAAGSGAAQSATVPEPAAITLILVFGTAIVCCRARQTPSPIPLAH